MKSRFFRILGVCCLGLLVLTGGADASAQGIFRSSARRWIRQADQLMEHGRQAEQEQRIMDACDAYSQAHELYRKAQMESPNTRTEHVARQDAESRVRLRTLFARAAAGQVSTPLPEAVMPMLDNRRTPPPSANPPPEPEIEEEGRIRPPPTEPEAPRELPDRELSRQVQTLLDQGGGAEAVILLEGILERNGTEATLTQRLLFAQALLNRRNYARAEGVLTALSADHPENLSVRMMLSGFHLAQGRPMAALRILDELVGEYPRYADAYVNLAYLRFAMDPAANRDEAIVYYRHALTLGAKRDPRLELELRVDIDF